MLYYIRSTKLDSRFDVWRNNLRGYTFGRTPIRMYVFCTKDDWMKNHYLKGKYYYWNDHAFKPGRLLE